MSEPTTNRATEVEDLSTARALIATLHDQLSKSQRENGALRHQLDVPCQRLFGKMSGWMRGSCCWRSSNWRTNRAR